MDTSSNVKQTALFQLHVEQGARMTAFGGFDMPLQYTGIIDEHLAVRNRAGLFDISHMGEVRVRGPQAAGFLQRLVTNDIERLYDGRALYTVMCTPEGGIVDDLLVYRLAEQDYMLVINAANIEKDVDWMRSHNTTGASLEDVSAQTALLALQGPKAPGILQSVTQEPLESIDYYHFIEPNGFLDCEEVILSRTGYTGEPGFELYLRPDDAASVWSALLEAGRDAGLQPVGLGARDTLRLEAGFCLYGNDISEETNPLEAGLSWLTRFDKGEFIGRDALQRVQEEGPRRKLVAFVMQERGIPRPDYPILDAEGNEIGSVTSGTQSPIIEKGIGMGYVPNETRFTQPGAPLFIGVRSRQIEAAVKKPPLHKE